MSYKDTKNYADEYLAVVAQGKKIEALGTAFLREHGYGKFGKKLKRNTEHYSGFIALQSMNSR